MYKKLYVGKNVKYEQSFGETITDFFKNYIAYLLQ